ncbi:hypothetical protein STEG23_036663 [Scotinomys teguina]
MVESMVIRVHYSGEHYGGEHSRKWKARQKKCETEKSQMQEAERKSWMWVDSTKLSKPTSVNPSSSNVMFANPPKQHHRPRTNFSNAQAYGENISYSNHHILLLGPNRLMAIPQYKMYSVQLQKSP